MTDSDRRLLYTIVGAYLAMGVTWILVTDYLVNVFVPPGRIQALIESSKGALFVAATGAGLFVLIRSLLLWRRDSIEQTGARDEALDQLLFQSRLLDAVGQAVIATDPNGKTIYWNKAAEEMYGWSQDEALGSQITQLTVPQAAGEQADRILADIASSQDGWAGEYELVRKDGTTFPALVKDTPVTGPDGQVIAIIGVSTDISDLVQARERLAQSEELHRAVLENISDAVFLTDERGNLTYVCPNVHIIFGIQQAEAMQMGNVAQLLGKELAGAEALMGTSEFSNIETEVIDAGGRRHDLLTTIKRVEMAAGDLLYSCRDVTERVEAEKERERALARLQVLREIDIALLGAGSAQELTSSVLASLRQVVEFEFATLFSVVPDNQWLRMDYYEGEPFEYIQVGDVIEFDELAVEQVSEELSQPVRYIEDLRSLTSATRLVEELIQLGLRSVVSVRLFARGSLVGVLALGLQRASGFDEETIAIVTEAASPLGIAIQNLEYSLRQRERARVMDTLREAALDLTSHLDLNQVVQAVCQRALELAEADNAHIFYFDGQELDFAAAVWREGFSETVYKNPRSDGLTATVARSGEAIVVDDSTNHPLYQDAYRDWHGGIIGIPFKFQGNVIAVMNVSFQRPHHFDDDEIRALQLLGDQAAIAITNARSFEEIEQQRAELSKMLDIARRLATDHTLDDVLQTIVEAVVETLPGAEASSVMLYDAEAQVLEVRAWCGHDDAIMGNLSLQPDTSLAGEVFLSQQARILNRAQEESTFVLFGIPELDRLQALFGIPLVVSGETVGALFADNFTQEDAFSSKDLPFMESLAAQASQAIESAYLFEQIQASRQRLAELSSQLVEVQEEERRHLARELHDQIGQSLTGLKLLLEMSAGLSPDEAGENLAQAQDLVGELLGQIRDLSLDLRPSMLDDLGLVPALGWLVDRTSRTSGLEIELVQDVHDERFESDIETAAYRIVQEGLTNAIRHSGSALAIVRVTRAAGALQIEVEDYGRGFDVESALADPSRSGLSGMRERVMLLGGRITIDSNQGVGSLVRVEFPLEGWLERRARERGP